MKRIITSAFFLAALVVVNTGCKKSDFDNNYNNPDKAVTADVPRLYAGFLYNEKVLPRYWNLYTFLIPMMGTYSQTSGYTNGKGIYEQATNYTADRWNYYYTYTMAEYRELEKYYNALSTDADKTGYLLFLETARIFLYDQTTQMVDMWGDIPFSKAGSLSTNATIVPPAYDMQEDIYDSALTNLKRISDYLSTVTPVAFYSAQLKNYDYLNGGDVLKWRQYCNSLILRLAMRISYKDEATAKSLVQTILSDPTKYPVIADAASSIKFQATSVTSNLVASDANEIRNGFGVNPFAPGAMVDNVMVPANDPRLPIFFTVNASNQYHGIANTLTEAQVTTGITANQFSRWDSTTFSEDRLLPGIIITAAEVSFLKAEAFERWGSIGGGTAKDAYETGIRQSITFWQSVNANSNYSGTKEALPSETAITAYLNQPSVLYGTNNLAKIATQKWINFTVMQADQAWAEIRRTNLPALSFPTDASSVGSPNVPTRLLYPGSESSLNSANYQAVKAKDNVTTKIFWDVQ